MQTLEEWLGIVATIATIIGGLIAALVFGTGKQTLKELAEWITTGIVVGSLKVKLEKLRTTIGFTKSNILSFTFFTLIFASAAGVVLSNVGKLPSFITFFGTIIGVLMALIVVVGASRGIFTHASRVPVILWSLITVLALTTIILWTQPMIPVLPAVAEHLEDDSTRWTTLQGSTPQDTVIAKPTNLRDPIADRSALKISFTKGIPGNSVLTYRNLNAASNTTYFELDLSFYFPQATPIQALAFSMNKWVNHQRWEWAVQWQNVPGGGAPPSWRLWDGKDNMWLDIGVTQNLETNRWHTVHLYGDISSNGQVHYIGFSCDDVSVKLDQMFAPVLDQGVDKLAVMVELDGDSNRDSYDVYIKDVDFHWS